MYLCSKVTLITMLYGTYCYLAIYCIATFKHRTCYLSTLCLPVSLLPFPLCLIKKHKFTTLAMVAEPAGNSWWRCCFRDGDPSAQRHHIFC